MLQAVKIETTSNLSKEAKLIMGLLSIIESGEVGVCHCIDALKEMAAAIGHSKFSDAETIEIGRRLLHVGFGLDGTDIGQYAMLAFAQFRITDFTGRFASLGAELELLSHSIHPIIRQHARDILEHKTPAVESPVSRLFSLRTKLVQQCTCGMN